MAKKTMSWSKCQIEIGKTGENDVMATSLKSVGVIKDKSSTLEASEGEALEAKATGGELVAKEISEGGYQLKTRVIEPTEDLLTELGLGATSNGDFNVKTHVVEGNFSVKLTPKNVGGKGIKAPKCSVTYAPGWSEEEGAYADLTFDILKGEGDYWYSIFTKSTSTSTSS